jgi:hypothetical protein
MRSSVTLILTVALGLLLAFSGSAGAATKPTTGSISGPVTSVKGKTIKVKTTLSPTGTAAVSVGSATVISEQVTVTSAAVKTGVCVVAMGQKSTKGVVTATRLTITQPVKGACKAGFGGAGGNRSRAGGPPPGGGTTPPAGGRPTGGFGNNPNFGIAVGKVTSVKGASITVKGTSGSTRVTVSKKSQISETKTVGSAAVTAKSCVFVQGTSTDKGVTVKATSINLTKQSGGSCVFGRRGP